MTRKIRREVPTSERQIPHMDQLTFKPMTESQKTAMRLFKLDYNLVLGGFPGTGKSTLALALALEEVLDTSSPIERICLVRSAVQVREQGFVPGTLKEKQAIYEEPHIEIVNDLLQNKSAYATLTAAGAIKFTSTSVLRSANMHNAVIILDEAQNCTYHEIKTVITRSGMNSRLIICGDSGQNDLSQSRNRADVSGFDKMEAVTKLMPSFKQVGFGIDDIVRSDLVREFILAEMDYSDA